MGGLTRQQFLAGGAGLLAVGLGVRGWQTGLVGGGAREELWRQWRHLPWPSSVIAAGVLAASPHNSQPWRFRVAEGVITLEIDESRALGPVDPFLRQMWIGAGCALENMIVAAAGLGRGLAVITTATGTTVARLTAAGDSAEQPALLDAIERRHTNRGPYHRDRPLEPSLITELTAGRDPVARIEIFPATSETGLALAGATVDAARALVDDREFMRASDRWFRLTPRDEDRHRDGPSLRCAGLPAWKRVAAALAPPPSDEVTDQAWLTMTRERHCGTAPALGFITVRDPADRRQLVEAGRLWQHVQLQATARGLAFQPLDQLPELADREQALHRPASAAVRLAGLGSPGHVPVFLFRLGWPQGPAPASARRPLASFLAA